MGNESSSSAGLGEALPNNLQISWKKVVCENVLSRDGHCACPCGDKMYIFGGVIQSKDSDSKEKDACLETNELMVFDPKTERCEAVAVSGDIPRGRSSATMQCVHNKLYLFGGLSSECGWFDDVHVFNTETKTWEKVETSGTKPSPRDKVASSVIADTIYVFGGFGPLSTSQADNILSKDAADVDDDDVEEEDDTENSCEENATEFGWFDDLYAFDTATNTWNQPLQMNKKGPTPRAASTTCSSLNLLYIFGGRDRVGRCNDLHVFDTVSKRWIEDKQVQGRFPESRSFHCAVTVGTKMLISGGRSHDDKDFSDAHVFDTETSQWMQPEIIENFPGRGCHVTCLVGDDVVVFGGSADFSRDVMQCRSFFNDFYVFHAAGIQKGGVIDKIPVESSHTTETTPEIR